MQRQHKVRLPKGEPTRGRNEARLGTPAAGETDLQGASAERTVASGISQSEKMVFLTALSGEILICCGAIASWCGTPKTVKSGRALPMNKA